MTSGCQKNIIHLDI